MLRAKQNAVCPASSINYKLIFGRLLLLYQMPKTGSQTVEASLRQCPLPHTILRFHYLSSTRAEELREACKNEGNWIRRQETRERLRFMRRLARILRIRNWLRSCHIKVPRLEIISAVREPIGLGLASIFENYRSFGPDVDSLTPELCSKLLQGHPKLLKSLEDWFDVELKPVVGIDIYETPFQQERGYAIYENRFARLLVYRFEALPLVATMLKEFLGCDIPRVISQNIGSSKEYGRQYTYVKNHLRFCAEFVSARCNTQLMRHFYNDQERQAYERKWSVAEERVSPAQPC